MATTTVTRRIPPQRLINLINPVVRSVLASPLHAALDKALVIVHVKGRKTGRLYDIPVGYVAADENLIVVTQHAWRANLRGGADLEVTHLGHRQHMHADLDEDPATVATTFAEIIGRVGPKAAERQLGLRLHGRSTSISELQDVVHDCHLATLVLRPQTRTC